MTDCLFVRFAFPDGDDADDLLTTMEVLGTDKQFAADDDVEADLHDHRKQKEERELGHLEDGRPDSAARSSEHEYAQLDSGARLTWRTTQSVVEEGRETTEQGQRPDDGQYRQDSTSTTDDVCVDRVNDRYVPETKHTSITTTVYIYSVRPYR